MRFLLFTLLLACGDPKADRIDCEGLDEATCDEAEGCWSNYGSPMHGGYDCDNRGPKGFAGCTSGDGLCSDVPIVGAPPDAPEEYWLFGSACVPDGWTAHDYFEICPWDTY